MKPDELECAYHAYGREVYLYALSLCRDPHEAEELASDAFYKAFLSLEELLFKPGVVLNGNQDVLKRAFPKGAVFLNEYF